MLTDPESVPVEPAFQPLFDLRAVCRIADKSEPFMRAEIQAGRLRALRLGISIRIRPADLEAWLNAAPVATGPDPRRDGRRRGKKPGRPRKVSVQA